MLLTPSAGAAVVAGAPRMRPYQQLAVDHVQSRLAAGAGRCYIELPTGCGKTVVLAELARLELERGGRILVIAHRRELIDQLARAMRAAIGANNVGIVMAKSHDDARPVTVATIQSMRLPRLLRLQEQGAITLLLVDEVHHVTPDNAYGRLIVNLGDARVVGCSATPFRADGDGMREVVPHCAFSRSIAQMQRGGWLCPLDWRRVRLGGLDLARIKLKRAADGIDYDQAALDQVIGAEDLVHQVVEATRQPLQRRRAVLVFGVSVDHARALAEAYAADGFPARAAWGDMPREERDEVLREWRAGSVQLVANCALFTEGFDFPAIDAVVIARPTANPGHYLQMVGRGTRTADGKADSLIIDVAGNISELDDHQVLLPHVWSAMPVEVAEGAGGRRLGGLREVAEGRKERPLFAASPITASGVAWAEEPESGTWGFSRGLNRDTGGIEFLLLVPDPSGSGLWRSALAQVRGSQAPQLIRARKRVGTLYDEVKWLLRSVTDQPHHSRLADREAGWRKGPPTDRQLAALSRLNPTAAAAAQEDGWTRGEVSIAIDEQQIRRIVEALPDDLRPPMNEAAPGVT